MKRFIKDLIQRFVMIYGFSSLATLFFLSVFNPNVQIGKEFLFNLMIFSLVANFPTFIYYLKEDMNDKETLLCDFGCAFLELVFLLPLGHFFGMWQGISGFIVFTIVTIIITFSIRFILYGKDVYDAKMVLDKLKELEGEDDE